MPDTWSPRAQADHAELGIAIALAAAARKRTWKDYAAYFTIALLAFVSGLGVRSIGVPAGAAAPPPHVMVVLLENKGYAATLGSCGADPYLCGLASTYASVTGWTGVTHPSEPNYVAFESGSVGACTGDTSCPAFSVTRQDLGGQLSAAGIPWVSWQESMPSACYTGQTSGNYALKHSFGGFFADDKTPCRIQPYPGSSSAVATLTGASAPDFVWITPNLVDDMHSGTVTAGDNWLKANVAPILASSWFTNFDSTVVITMDEHSGDNTGGGGAVPEVVISNNAKGVGKVAKAGNHYGNLRTIEEAFGLPLLGAATGGTDLSSLFGSSVTPPTPTPSATPSATPSPTGTPTASPTPTPSSTPTPTGPPVTVACSGDVTAALQKAVNVGGTVTIGAGTCALSNHITVTRAVDIEGAGALMTFLVQHARKNIFQVTAPGVTIGNLNVDTATFNPGVPPVLKNPVPGTIFSNKSHTTIHDLYSESGTGFGIRVVGPNPCSSDLTTGTVVTNVNVTNKGRGGFTALDLDCSNGVTLSNLTINGDYVALYLDRNVSLNGENYTPDAKMCQAPVYVTTTTSTTGITVNNVTGGGKVIVKPASAGVKVTNDTPVAGC